VLFGRRNVVTEQYRSKNRESVLEGCATTAAHSSGWAASFPSRDQISLFREHRQAFYDFAHRITALDCAFLLSTHMLGASLGSGGLNPLYQIGGPRSAQLALKLQF
jgi:hypothetical protein